jgi:hypothetical protein
MTATSICHPGIVACLGYDIKDDNDPAALQPLQCSPPAGACGIPPPAAAAAAAGQAGGDDSHAPALPAPAPTPGAAPLQQSCAAGAEAGGVSAPVVRVQGMEAAAAAMLITLTPGSVPMTPANTAQPPMIKSNPNPTPLKIEVTALCSLRCRSTLRFTFNAVGFVGFISVSS